MKKLLSILVLSLMFSGNAYADCFDDIDFSKEVVVGLIFN